MHASSFEPAVPGGPRVSVADRSGLRACLVWWSNWEARGLSTGPAPSRTPSASGRRKGRHDRPQSRRPGQARLEDPRAVRPGRAPLSLALSAANHDAFARQPLVRPIPAIRSRQRPAPPQAQRKSQPCYAPRPGRQRPQRRGPLRRARGHDVDVPGAGGAALPAGAALVLAAGQAGSAEHGPATGRRPAFGAPADAAAGAELVPELLVEEPGCLAPPDS
jgi:hypothetical protein